MNKPGIEQIEVVKQANVDIDGITRFLFEEFKDKTVNIAANFVKVAKKNDIKQTRRFIKKNVIPIWKSMVEEKFQEMKEIDSFLTQEELTVYVSGIFITLFARDLKNLPQSVSGGLKEDSPEFIIKLALSEMAVAASKKATGKQP